MNMTDESLDKPEIWTTRGRTLSDQEKSEILRYGERGIRRLLVMYKPLSAIKRHTTTSIPREKLKKSAVFSCIRGETKSGILPKSALLSLVLVIVVDVDCPALPFQPLSLSLDRKGEIGITTS